MEMEWVVSKRRLVLGWHLELLCTQWDIVWSADAVAEQRVINYCRHCDLTSPNSCTSVRSQTTCSGAPKIIPASASLESVWVCHASSTCTKIPTDIDSNLQPSHRFGRDLRIVLHLLPSFSDCSSTASIEVRVGRFSSIRW
eukprot:300785-Rhodomonas_salina.3